MKKAVTFRLDAELLERARDSADADNRTLTNYVETAILRALTNPPKPAETLAPRSRNLTVPTERRKGDRENVL